MLPSVAAIRGAWRELATTSASLGASTSERRDLHVCPTCERAAEVDGPTGTAAERAVLEHLGAAARAGELDFGVSIAWAAQRRRGAPNRSPWAHLDLEDLRRSLGIAVP